MTENQIISPSLDMAALIPQSVAVTLPGAAVSPVDVYINSLASLRSQATMKTALRSVVRLMIEEDWVQLDPAQINDDMVKAINWPSMTRAHLDAIRAALIRSYEPAGAVLRLNAVRGVIKKAWNLELISTDAYLRAVGVQAITVHPNDTGRALSREELSGLLVACAGSDHYTAARDAALLAVMFFGGLRREEAVMLDVGDYQPDESSIKVKGKGRKKRVTYICDDGMDVLNHWLEVRATAKVPIAQKQLFVTFHKSGGQIRKTRMSTSTVNKMVRRVCLTHGLPVFTPHDCRRTFATMLFAAGADVFLVQSLMGHAKSDTTRRYDKRPEVEKRKAVQLLNLKS